MCDKSPESNTSKRNMWITLGVIGAVILIGLAVIYLLIHTFLGGIKRIDPAQTFPTVDPQSLVGENETVETDPLAEEAKTIFKGKEIVNILLVGQDRLNGEAEEPQCTDAMILCTINKSTGTITMTSFLRDLWVYIPGYYNQRLNIPYQLGGFPLLNKTLRYNFGVVVDYNVEIDFSGFMEAVNAMGGLEMQLTVAEAKYLNQRGNWDIEHNKDWDLKPGVNLLTGSQALAYSRIRQLDTDFGRTDRQRKVLTAIIEDTKNLNTTEMFDFTRKMMPLIRTDMNDDQILTLLRVVFPILQDPKVVSQRFPMDGQYSFVRKNGTDAIILDNAQMEANRALLTAAMSD